MKILWFTWKDVKNPYSGGAEIVNEELAKRLVKDGHEVIFLVRGFPGGKEEEIVDGYKIIRLGNYHTVYWEAYKYYKKNLKGWADLVIEEVNTIPFFCNFYVHPVKSAKDGACSIESPAGEANLIQQGGQFNRGKEKSILFFHQLCREIWFHEMGFLKGLVGYILETIYLFFLGNREIITVSESTKKDLNRFGFRRNKIKIISEGIEIEPVQNLNIEKFENPTILSLGAFRPMKRTDHIIKAFELAKKELPDLKLVIAGDTFGGFAKKVLEMIEKSPYKDSIQCLGRVSKEKKIELMQKSHLIVVVSVKEGWGLVVTEANSQGTPAVVYDSDGFRDSVRHGITGIVCEKNNPENLSRKIGEILSSNDEYEKLRQNAWQWSKEISFERSYEDFKKHVM